jgi:hypothetical protein
MLVAKVTLILDNSIDSIIVGFPHSLVTLEEAVHCSRMGGVPMKLLTLEVVG